MKSSIAFALALIFLGGCTSQTSTFVVDNETDETLENTVIFQDDDATELGSIEPGRGKRLQFRTFSENTYTLKYNRGGKEFAVHLCYQGMNYPADGVVTISETGPSIVCK
jgi:hypothetical protein